MTDQCSCWHERRHPGQLDVCDGSDMGPVEVGPVRWMRVARMCGPCRAAAAELARLER